MNPFERALIREIPIADACEYFLKLKYGSASTQPTADAVMQAFSVLSVTDQAEILKEAGIEKEAFADLATAGLLGGMKGEQHGEPVQGAVRGAGGFALGGYPAAVLGANVAERLGAGPVGTGVAGLGSGLVGGVLGYKALTSKYDKKPSKKKEAAGPADIQQYLSQEREGMAAQEQNEGAFMRQRMMEMQQQVQMSEQGQQATSSQMAQLEQQIQASQQQIQMAQQSAMQAQSMATTAQQGQLSATDEAMRNAQLAAQMRMSYQQLRSQIMDVVSQDPASDLAAQLKGQTGIQGLGAEGVSMGQPPSDGTPGAPMQGPAGQAAGAQAAPGAAPPEGETGANNANASKNPSQDSSPKPASETKQAGAAGVGAMVGGALGGIGTALESRVGSEGLKGKVQQMESQQGGFGHALNLAQAKIRLALSEVAEKHPTAATLTGSLMGAATGAGAAGAAQHLMGK